VLGFDLDRSREAQLTASDGRFATSAVEVWSQCDVVLLSLPDSRTAHEVLQAARPHLRSSQLVVDTSTGDPRDAETAAAMLSQHGVGYLDATVLGSSELVRQGEAVLMIGGRAADFEAASRTLEHIGRKLFFVGPAGSGSRMKLVVNLALGLHRAVLAEALALARGLELDQALALEVLKSGAAYSAVMDLKGDKMLSGDFTPQARLSQHLKDVHLMLSAAEQAGLKLPLSETHRDLLERAVAQGFGDADNSAVLRAYDR
jgi:3-hydroxyisobutyrate dehydrogenase-like beta-hydroxyacid dehydrogenase